MSENIATMITGVSLLTIFIAKDDESYMAKCPELDLITEMNTKEEALKAIVEMIVEYAEDLNQMRICMSAVQIGRIINPILMRFLACNDEWELMELLEVRYAHLHL